MSVDLETKADTAEMDDRGGNGARPHPSGEGRAADGAAGAGEAPRPEEEAIGWKPVFKACVLAAMVVLGLTLVYATPLKGIVTDTSWRDSLKLLGIYRELVFIIGGAVLIGVGFPRVAYCLMGGAVFGFLMGTLWSLVGTVLGSVGCFFVARRLGREWVYAKFGRRYRKIEKLLREQGFSVMLLVRLCPVGNNFLTNCLAGVTAIRKGSFIWASALGFLPLTINFALLGSGLAKARHNQTAISLALILIVAIAFAVYYRQSPLARRVVEALRDKDDA